MHPSVTRRLKMLYGFRQKDKAGAGIAVSLRDLLLGLKSFVDGFLEGCGNHHPQSAQCDMSTLASERSCSYGISRLLKACTK